MTPITFRNPGARQDGSLSLGSCSHMAPSSTTERARPPGGQPFQYTTCPRWGNAFATSARDPRSRDLIVSRGEGRGALLSVLTDTEPPTDPRPWAVLSFRAQGPLHARKLLSFADACPITTASKPRAPSNPPGSTESCSWGKHSTPGRTSRGSSCTGSWFAQQEVPPTPAEVRARRVYTSLAAYDNRCAGLDVVRRQGERASGRSLSRPPSWTG